MTSVREMTARITVTVVVAFLMVAGSLITGVQSAVAAPPDVTIGSVTAGFTQIAVSGSVDPHGEAASIYAEYENQPGHFAFTLIAEIPAGTSGPTAVSGTIGGLAPGTAYVVRLDAETVADGETYSPQPYPSATTKVVAKPAVSIAAPSALSPFTAEFVGQVNPNSPEAEGSTSADEQAAFGTAWQFRCTPGCPDGETEGSLAADRTAHTVSGEAVGLEPGTTYEVELTAVNRGGETVSAPRSFTTPGIPPSIAKPLAISVGENEAILSAEINPGGEPTTYHIDYGPTSSYGSSTSESTTIGEDNELHKVSGTINGLTPGTEYHWRIVADNVVETSNGPDRTFRTPSASGLPTAGCPNQEFRIGPAALLPDCRAYEQVSPAEKGGASVQRPRNVIHASPDGDRITFIDPSGLPTTGGTSTIPVYVSKRTGNGWATNGMGPVTEQGANGFKTLGWNPELTATAFEVSSRAGGQLTLENVDSATYTSTLLAGRNQLGLSLGGFAADPAHLVFESQHALTSGAFEGNNVYELDHGSLSLADRIPAGAATSCDDAGVDPCVPAPEGGFAGASSWTEGSTTLPQEYRRNVISSDGDKVFFTTANAGQIYMREGQKTFLVSASQRALPDPNGPRPAAFLEATPDGSLVYFLSCAKLTEDSTAVSTSEDRCVSEQEEEGGEPYGQDLYAYDTVTHSLADLTIDEEIGDTQGAQIIGFLGGTPDGSYIYFVANGVLAPGATPGNCVVRQISVERGGVCNLYVLHEGLPTLVSKIRGFGADQNDWRPAYKEHGSRVAPSGTLLFTSTSPLTGYDNTVAEGGCYEGFPLCPELFRYEPGAVGRGLACLSCNPTGAAPTGAPSLDESTEGVSLLAQAANNLTRGINAAGTRVFFDSPDRLVSQDRNDVTDPYEWEAPGIPGGSCLRAEVEGGCLYLLSSGSSVQPSYVGDISESGDDAFIFSPEPLVPQDRDGLLDVYDVRVDGGLSAQFAPSPGQGCSSTPDCRSTGSPLPSPAPAGTASLSGPGNRKSVVCRKPKKKIHGKCRGPHVSKHSKKHRGGKKKNNPNRSKSGGTK